MSAMEGISIIIPCRNESRRLAATERRLHRLIDYLEKESGLPVQAVIEEDGSDDGTLERIRDMSSHDRRILTVDGGNLRGKGRGIRLAVSRSRYEYLVVCDADLPVAFRDMALIARELREYDVVLPSRRAAGSKCRGIPLARRIASYAFNRYVNLVLGLGISDTQNGVKGIRREAFPKIAPDRLGSYSMDVEMLLRARRLNLRIKEIPVDYMHERTSNFSVIRDGPRMLADVIVLRLS